MNKSGFSLLEVMVAIGILTIGLVAVVTLLNANIRTNQRAIDHIRVQNLAEEAVTYLQVTRDENVLNGSAWDTFISCGATGCNIGYFSGNFAQPCVYDVDDILDVYRPKIWSATADSIIVKYNDQLGFYQITDGTICATENTQYTRRIDLTNIDADTIGVTVTIDSNRFDPDSFKYILESKIINPN